MRKLLKMSVILPLIFLLIAGCADDGLRIKVDGSSTVAPITEAVIEDFRLVAPDAEITMGISGTGGGFKKFVAGETDISNASREIKDKEMKEAEKNGVEYFELEVAKDAITIVVSQENNWAKNLTVEQLRAIWQQGSKVKKWSDLDSSWPMDDIKLFGPGQDSGTYDYFHDVILDDVEMRGDYSSSEDDNVLVTGISGDKNALGFLGYAYYKENAQKLKALNVDNVAPTDENIGAGDYIPLSRAVFIYVNLESYRQQAVIKKFVDFYLDEADILAPELGFPALDDKVYQEQKEKLQQIAAANVEKSDAQKLDE